jgi:hypothetical protein
LDNYWHILHDAWTFEHKKDLTPKTIKLKRGDIHIRTRADLTAILRQDKRDICILNIYDVPAEGNFCS